jgi:hypothetical protein
MLDVHPSHHALRSWADFFIHIATITVGLLIALGLEAAVEAHHHHRQVEETREALTREHAENLSRFAANAQAFRRDCAVLENDLLVLNYLEQHPGARAAELPGVLLWDSRHIRMEDSAWKAAQQTGVTARIPQDEVMRTAELYGFFERIDKAHEGEADAIAEAVGYTFRDPDPTHLTPAQISAEIALTQRVLSRHLRYGYLLQNLAEQYPEFHNAPTHAELDEMMHLPELNRKQEFTGARAITISRVNAAAPPGDEVTASPAP